VTILEIISKNELDFENLQKDVIAGLRRLSRTHPNLVEEVKHLLK